MQTDGVQTRAKAVGLKVAQQHFLNKFFLAQCLLCSAGFFFLSSVYGALGLVLGNLLVLKSHSGT